MPAPLPFTWNHVLTTGAYEWESGAAQPLKPAPENRITPFLIRSAADLPEKTAYVFDASGELRLSARKRPYYNFHWLREVALGVIKGDLGLVVDSGSETSVEYRLAGRFTAVISLDEQRWLRLRILKNRDAQLNLATHLWAKVTGTVALPDQPEQLLAAILGVHEGQWLAELSRLVKTRGSAAAAARLGIAEDLLKSLVEQWDKLDARTSAAIWKALGPGGDLEPLRTLDAAAPLLAQGPLLDTLLRLKNYAEEFLAPARLQQALTGGVERADEWARQQLADWLGLAGAALNPGAISECLRPVVSLGDAIYRKLATAVEKNCAAEFSYSFESSSSDTALIDCSFDFTPEGLRAYQEALGGDYSRILRAPTDHARLGQGVLTHSLSRQTHIELHLPFFERKEWKSRLEALAKVEVEAGEDGRLLAYSVQASDSASRTGAYQSSLALAGSLALGRAHSTSHFTLSYTDTRTHKSTHAPTALAPVLTAYGFDGRAGEWLGAAVAGGGVDSVATSLSLAVPGDLASAWLIGPGERDANFFSVYSQVSVAVQAAMRRWLPYSYFHDLGQYETLGAAFPLLVYQSSRPFAGRPRSDFTYDVMSQESRAAAIHGAGQKLPAILACVQKLLVLAGRPKTAAFYAPRQASSILSSVERSPRQLYSLLIADAFFVGSLVKLALEGRQLAQDLPRDPQKAVKELTRFCADFVKAFHGRLRRLYGGQDFLALGSLILVEATRALSGAMGAGAGIQAVLRLKAGDAEQTFVNADYRP